MSLRNHQTNANFVEASLQKCEFCQKAADKAKRTVKIKNFVINPRKISNYVK